MLAPEARRTDTVPFRHKRGSGARRTLRIAQRPRSRSPRHRVWQFKPWMLLLGNRVLLQPRRMYVFSLSTQWTAQRSPFLNSVLDTNIIKCVSKTCSRTGNTDLVPCVKQRSLQSFKRESDDLRHEKAS